MFGETSHEILGVACGVVPVAAPCDGYDEAQWLIDGRLIAAAPDLLGALRDLVAAYAGTDDLLGPSMKAKLTAARNAIAKAEGCS